MGVKRRMFSAEVLRTADFMYLSKEAQILYVQLCIEADDRGVVDIATIIVSMLREIGVEKIHLQELIDSGLIIQIEEKLHLITDWYIQNQISADVFHESKYKEKIIQSFALNEISRYVSIESPDAFKSVPEYEKNEDGKKKKTQKKCEKNAENLQKNCEKNAENLQKNCPQYSIVEYSRVKDSIVKNNNTHTSLGDDPAEIVCAGDCVCVDSCDSPDALPANTDPPLPDDPHMDDLSPVDDFPDDNTSLTPKELTNKAEEVRKKLKAAGLGVPDEISWQMRDFRFALDGKRRLHLSDDEFFGALENYATLLSAKKDKPGAFWWDSEMPVPSLFKGNSPPVMRFLPYAFDLDNFRTGKGKQGGGVKRGIDQSANYDASEIAERQAAQFAEQDAMHDDAYYANAGF